MDKFQAESQGKRLDVFLSETLEGLSRKKARLAIEKGQVEVNGRKERPGYLVQIGDEISSKLVLNAEVKARPYVNLREDKTPEIVYECDDYFVIEKPRAVHCVTLSQEGEPTLADWLARVHPECLQASPDPRESGLIQRLDYFTSGLLLAAKNRKAWEALRESLMSEKVEKKYLALVEGYLSRQEVQTEYLMRPSKDRKRMRVGGGKEAVETSCKFRQVREPSKNTFSIPVDIVEAFAPKAHRHQVRVHLAQLGNPIVGDKVYGSNLAPSQLGLDIEEGFLLHASEISFEDPFSGRNKDFRSKPAFLEGANVK